MAVGDDPLDARDRSADAGDLRLGLAPAADDAERHGVFMRQVTRGHGTRGPGPEPPEMVGLDQRDELGARSVEERDDEDRAGRPEAGVHLGARKAELEIGDGHVGERAFLERKPAPRGVRHRPGRHPSEARLHRRDGVLRREQLFHVALREEEGHRNSVPSRTTTR